MIRRARAVRTLLLADDEQKIDPALARFGEPVGASPQAVAVRLASGTDDLADVVRALDADGLRVEHLQLHAPSLDDVFLEKTGRSLEGAGDAPEPVAA